MTIKKAVIPVAGKGTRFLPASKNVPKEMIPIINVPMIYYIVEEAVNSGIEEIIFVSSIGKEAIENFFNPNHELEKFLEEKGKTNELELVKKIGSMCKTQIVIQDEQLGLGHAINCAKNAVGNEAFAVLLGDDIALNEYPVTKQLIDVYEKEKGTVIGVMEVENSETSKYGIVDGQFLEENTKTLKMKEMVEKPKPEEAPTNLATPGRYILDQKIFKYLDEIPRGVGGEYQLTDAINLLCHNENVYAHIFDGQRYDTGNVFGYLEATIEFALNNDVTKDYMKQLILKKAKDFK